MSEPLTEPTVANHVRLWDTIRRVAGPCMDKLLADVADQPRIVVGGIAFRVTVAAIHEEHGGLSYLALLYPAEPVPLPNAPAIQRAFGLTAREAEVALLLARRRSNREVAEQLGVRLVTAERHAERVLAKLGVRSRRDVEVALASRHAPDPCCGRRAGIDGWNRPVHWMDGVAGHRGSQV